MIDAIVAVVFVFALVVIITGPVFLLMHKLGLPNKYWSLVPIVHLFFLAQIGEMGLWVPLLLLIPLVNILVLIHLWYRAYENIGANVAWSYLYIIPLLGLMGSWIVAASSQSGPWRPRRA